MSCNRNRKQTVKLEELSPSGVVCASRTSTVVERAGFSVALRCISRRLVAVWCARRIAGAPAHERAGTILSQLDTAVTRAATVSLGNERVARKRTRPELHGKRAGARGRRSKDQTERAAALLGGFFAVVGCQPIHLCHAVRDAQFVELYEVLASTLALKRSIHKTTNTQTHRATRNVFSVRTRACVWVCALQRRCWSVSSVVVRARACAS